MDKAIHSDEPPKSKEFETNEFSEIISSSNASKSLLEHSKIINMSQELVASSTNFSASSTSTYSLEKTDKSSKHSLAHKTSNNNMALLASATSFSNPNYKSNTSIDKDSNRNNTSKTSYDSNEKVTTPTTTPWIAKESINSTSSIITNLFENNEENFDLFGSGNAFSSNSKSLSESSSKESPKIGVSKTDSIKESETKNVKPSDPTTLTDTSASTKLRDEPNSCSKTKLIIYDNNMAPKSEETQESKLGNKFRADLSLQLLKSQLKHIENVKSKSCERIDIVEDPEESIGEKTIDEPIVENKTCSNDLKSEVVTTTPEIESPALAKETGLSSKLAYSKSLKLTPKVIFEINDTHVSAKETSENNEPKVAEASTGFTKILKEFSNEPTWKELAFKKQNAW